MMHKQKRGNSHLHFEKKRNLLKCKRSQGHVEMILAFVIFVGFLLAIFIFIMPTKERASSYSAVDNVEKIMLQNLSADYYYTSLILVNGDLPQGKNCFSVANQPNLAGNILAKDMSKAIKNSDIDSSEISISHTNGNRFYELYFSDYFNSYPLNEPGRCASLGEGDYSFSIAINSSAVLYENLKIFEEEYMKDYEGLKKSLKISDDFSFVVYNLTRGVLFNESLSKHKLAGINVLSREMPLKAINKNAVRSDIILNLRVW